MSWFKFKSGRGTDAQRSQQNELQDFRGQVAAFSRSQVMIEFTLDGKILTANENFLATLGYTLDEIWRQHHSMFVDPTYRGWDKRGGENSTRGSISALQGRQGSMVRATIGLARGLGLTTIAEGVEMSDQLSIRRTDATALLRCWSCGRADKKDCRMGKQTTRAIWFLALMIAQLIVN